MKKRIKQIIGVIIGIIIGISTTVGATTIFNSKDITYSSDKTSKTNVKDSLDELYNKTGKCPEGQYCYTEPLGLSDKVELGDYIKMTPTSTSYTPPGELTGCMNDANCKQNTLNPSELNLWRVIKKNKNGTVDAVSVYASSEMIYFRGKTGYMNFIGALNTIAAQYTNEKYVKSTRNIGYKNQIEYCTSYEESSCPKDGRGAAGHDLIVNVFGTFVAEKKAGGIQRYWVSTRRGYEESSAYGFGYWVEDACPKDNGSSSLNLCGWRIYNTVDDKQSNSYSAIRPIVTLDSSIKIKSGDGKSIETAYVLE